MKYVYPAKIVYDPTDGAYNVDFPDDDRMIAYGWSLFDAIQMSEEVLASMLTYYEDKNRTIPKATSVNEHRSDDPNVFVTFIRADTDEYRKSEDYLSRKDSDEV